MSSLPLPPPPPHSDPALDPGASSSAGGKKKRGGAPKAKGAVRAKSGCYTCRIRRKKCDEQPDRDGNCQTCVRLRLECLGFGAKRPDWMRENNSVQELREKIKQFLASQGMIKGHSGGGVRPADQDPSVLNLSTEVHLPQNAAMQANGDRMRQPPHMPPMSAVRDGAMHEHLVHFTPLPGGPPFPPPPGQGHPPLGPPQHPMLGTLPFQLDPDLANMPHMPPHAYGHASAPPPPPPNSQQQAPSHTMSSIPASPWPSAPSLQHSSFGASYNINDNYLDNQVQEDGRGSNEIVPAVPTSEVALYAYPRTEDSMEASYVSHYMEHVLQIQYLLADLGSIKRFIYQFAHTSPAARSAMCLLSAVHQQRMRQLGFRQQPVDSTELDRLLRQTKSLLRRTEITEGDAMAGLHVVSCFLFMGGRGPWERFLDVALYWVHSILTDTRYSGPLEAYRQCSESTQFIIRTTMWFDVWSAITRKTRPKFGDIYRQLFDNEHGYPGSQVGDVDMLSVMGCTNETVLAMSETACLAAWKESQQNQGTLSMPTLVERGRQIENRYLSREHDAPLSAEGGSDDLDTRRRLAANVFRSSARVYLHTVLSGCLSHVEEIAYGVEETVNILKRVPDSSGASRSVVRSVVLSIALCGCMTDDASHRKFLSDCLVSLAGHEVEVLGNCRQAKELMERVWDRRDHNDMAVDWRDVISEMSTTLLLV